MFLSLFLYCSRCSSSPSVVANTDGLGGVAPNVVDGCEGVAPMSDGRGGVAPKSGRFAISLSMSPNALKLKLSSLCSHSGLTKPISTLELYASISKHNF